MQFYSTSATLINTIILLASSFTLQLTIATPVQTPYRQNRHEDARVSDNLPSPSTVLRPDQPVLSKFKADRPAVVDDGSYKFALRFLRKYGYIGKAETVVGASQSIKPHLLRKALRRYQEFYNLPVTGILDVATRTKMNNPRCGMPDVDNGGISKRRRKRFNVAGRGIIKGNKVTYKLKKPSRRLPRAAQHALQARILDRAFAVWQKHIDVDFQRAAPDERADLEISFELGAHLDGMPFDGAGGQLGHAFYPDDINWGQVHFDDEEAWVPTGRGLGRSFLWTAAHELGHALGLAHSVDNNAIMHSEYLGYDKYDVALGEDDVAGIQMLYKPRPQCTDGLACNKRRICKNPSFDAIFELPMSDGTIQTYFVQDDLVYHRTDAWEFEDPLTIGQMFNGIKSPDMVDEVFTDYFGYTRVFHGRSVWVYDFSASTADELILPKDNTLTEASFDRQSVYSDLPQQDVDAVLILPRSTSEIGDATYFFQGTKYFRNGGDRPHGKADKWIPLTQISPSLAGRRVDATLAFGNTYMLFSGDQYFIVQMDRNHDLKSVDRNKPLNCSVAMVGKLP